MRNIHIHRKMLPRSGSSIRLGFYGYLPIDQKLVRAESEKESGPEYFAYCACLFKDGKKPKSIYKSIYKVIEAKAKSNISHEDEMDVEYTPHFSGYQYDLYVFEITAAEYTSIHKSDELIREFVSKKFRDQVEQHGDLDVATMKNIRMSN